jgi:hypothetical protein
MGDWRIYQNPDRKTPWARVIATSQLTMALILGWTIPPAHLALADEVIE